MFGVIISIILAVLIIGVVIVIMFDDGDSGRKMAWLLVIALLPVVGLLLYLAFGINYRTHWYFNRRHQLSINAFSAGTNEKLNRLLMGHDVEPKVKEEFRPLARLLGIYAYPTVSEGNSFEIITNGNRKFELLMHDLEEAKEYIHLEYFHFGNDSTSKTIKNLLMKKATEGVKVRFIYENIANLPIISRYYTNMKKAGVEVLAFTNPRSHPLNLITTLNYRDHRKIVIIDGKIGYTGGMNINDNYFKIWRDTHLRLEGPAVASLQFVFMDAWITSGGTPDRPLLEYFPMVDAIGPHEKNIAIEPAEILAPKNRSALPDVMEVDLKGIQPTLHGKLVQVLPDEPDARWPLIQMSYEWVINNAKRYIYLQTPYFVPPEPLLNAIKSAGLRGVDIRLMVPEKADNFFMGPANSSYYQECLDAGVRIFLRKGQFIHSKTFVSDDYISSIGTANIDFRSFDINYEVNTYIYDTETAALNKAIFMKDLEMCEEITAESWKHRSWGRKVSERIMRLFSPLL